MPMILSLFGCILIILFIKNLKIVMSLSLLVFLSIFLLLAKNDARIKDVYTIFFHQVNIFNLIDFTKVINKKKDTTITMENTDQEHNDQIEDGKEKEKTDWSEGIWKKNWEGVILLRYSGHNRVFRTSIALWKEQPLFGFGLKSFRVKCWELLEKKAHLLTKSKISIFSCANHSHNYYLELLSETGIIGISLMIIFFLILLKNSFYCLKKYNQRTNSEIILLIPIIIVIFLEIWPIRSAGSFFTTWNATFFWLSVAILLSTKKQKSF